MSLSSCVTAGPDAVQEEDCLHNRGGRRLDDASAKSFAQRMVPAALYDDGRVMLDAEAVTLRRYYFPSGSPKRIPYRDIKDVRVQRMGWLTGKGRGWGTAHPRYWLPLDVTRPRKDKLVVLDLGQTVQPAFTPDEPERVVGIIRERLGRADD
jgi:hypothetical protein